MTFTVRVNGGVTSAQVVFKKGPEPQPKKKDGVCNACWAMGTNPNYQPNANDIPDVGKLATWQKVVLGVITGLSVTAVAAPAIVAIGDGCLATLPVCAAEISEMVTGGASGGSAVVGAGAFAAGAKALGAGRTVAENPDTLTAARRLLASIGEEGKTAGVLEVDGALIPLVSGKSPLRNYAASGHVEGQAALIMREMEATSGRLLIDNPNGICGYCTSQVPTLLPKGATLEVNTPLGTVTPSGRWSASKTFTGNGADPKPWPR
jgi:hypothetical protein